MSRTGYTNETYLKTEFYNNESKLDKRIDVWNKYGCNKIKYPDFILGLLDKEYKTYADLGCGNARVSTQIAKLISKKSYFVDISEEMLKAAKLRIQTAENSEHRSVFLNENFCETSIPTHSCELVTAMHSIQHTNKFNMVFDEISRIVSNSGTVLITTYDKTLTDWLNLVHYSLLRELDFPDTMLDTEEYLAFSGINARKHIQEYFGNEDFYIYQNDAFVTSVEDLMDYYASGMMFRGVDVDKQNIITKAMWRRLYDRMKEEAEKEMNRNSGILIDGKVLCAKIKIS